MTPAPPTPHINEREAQGSRVGQMSRGERGVPVAGEEAEVALDGDPGQDDPARCVTLSQRLGYQHYHPSWVGRLTGCLHTHSHAPIECTDVGSDMLAVLTK